MSDRFEEAVRQAARGLGDGDLGGHPDYRGAYGRGRRRRAFKQGGLACAGALVFLAALTIGTSTLSFRQDTQETDLALDVVVGTAERIAPTLEPAAPTAVPTTEPVTTPIESTEAATTLAAPTGSTTAAPPVDPAPESSAEPAATEPTVTASEQDPASAPTASTAENAPPVPSPVPTIAAESQTSEDPRGDEPTGDGGSASPDFRAADPEQGATATGPAQVDPATADSVTGDPVPSAPATADPNPSPPTVADTEQSPSADDPVKNGDTSEPGTEAVPNISVPDPEQVPDAVVLSPGPGTEFACDSDRDGTADATCRVLAPYPCRGLADLQPGYSGVDLDEDGAIDQCMAIDTTTCDTTGDGLADTPCTIEITGATALELPGELDEPDPDDVS